MPAHKTRLFAVIYTPYYRLQCARQKRLHALPEAVNASNQLELSIEKPMLECPVSLSAKVEEEKPVALLDTEGSRIIEVNPAAAAAGIEIGVTTSLALARTSELQLFAPATELEHQQQSALLQLCYRYSPYLENTAAGVCTLDLQGRKDHHPEWWARELLAQWRSLGFIAQIGIGPNPEVAGQAAKIANPFLQVTAESSLLQSLPFRIIKSLSLPFRYFTKLGDSNFGCTYPITSGRDRPTSGIGRIIVMGPSGRQIQKRTQTNPTARDFH